MSSRRVSRYVLREVLGPTVLGLALYMFVLLMNRFFLVAERALSKHLGLALTLEWFLSGTPSLLILAIPMAVLLGVLIGVGRLSADHEWIALQGAGRGPWILLRPVLALGLIGSLSSFAVYAWVVPHANWRLRGLRGEILFASNLAADLRPRIFYTQLPDNTVLFVDEIRPGGQRRLEGVLAIQENRQTRTSEVILARHGDLYPGADRSGDLILDLYEGVGHHYASHEPKSYRPATFAHFRKKLPAAAYLRELLAPPGERAVADLSLGDLWREYRESRRALAALGGAPPTPPSAPAAVDRVLVERRARTATLEWNQRLALPLASLCLVLLALPLGIHRVRSGKGAGFALSLLVIMIYWLAYKLARDQAWIGNLPAWVGPWGGNIVVLPWGAIALWRLRRRGVGSAPAARIRRFVGRLSDAWSRRRRGVNRGEGSSAPMDALQTLGGTDTRFVGRLDAFVVWHYLRMLLLSLASAYLVFGLVELQTLLDVAMRHDLAGSVLPRYLLYFLPGVFGFVLPVSCLVAGVVSVTVLARSGELVAVKASGVSMQRLTAPMLILTVALGGLLFLVQDRLAPGTNLRARELRDQLTGRPPRTHGPAAAGGWSFGPEGRTLYHYELYDAKTEVFHGLSVFTVDRAANRILDHRFAAVARWNGKLWQLERSWFRTFPGDGTSPLTIEDRPVELALDPPASFAGQQVSLSAAVAEFSEQSSVAELREQIQSLSRRGYDVTHLRVAYHGKFAQAFAPLVMVLLGLPFAFRLGRRGSLYGIGVALLWVLIYWATFAVANALGLETVLPPVVAAWAPNALFGLLGTSMLLYVPT